MHRILQTFYQRWKLKHVDEAAFRGERPDPHPGVVRRRSSQQLGEQGTTLAQPAALLEPAPRGGQDPEPDFGLVSGQ